MYTIREMCYSNRANNMHDLSVFLGLLWKEFVIDMELEIFTIPAKQIMCNCEES